MFSSKIVPVLAQSFKPLRLAPRCLHSIGLPNQTSMSTLAKSGTCNCAQRNTRCFHAIHMETEREGPTQVRGLHTAQVDIKTPDDALNVLRLGNARFLKGDRLTPNQSLERIKTIAQKQHPFAAFLSCADSRVPVEILFDQGFGDVFVTRVAGNVVTTEICASLEFGCAVLGAKVLYVLGHTKCGAVAATQAGGAVPGVISSLYYHIQPACDVHKTDCDAAVAENVKNQVRALQVSPVLKDLISKKKLKIVGGVYDLDSGKVTEVC